MNQTSRSNTTRIIIQTALFIALSVAVRSLSSMIYLFGIPGMRISFSGIFTRMPALLFGPFYGGIAGGLVDIIGYLLKPEGAYIPFLTLTQILDGVLVGLIWSILKNRDKIKIQKFLWIIFIGISAVGVFNYVNTLFFPESPITAAINAIGKKKDFFALGLLAAGVIGVILLLLDFFVGKLFPQAKINKYSLKVLFAFGIAGITVTTINTVILKIAFGIKADFVLFWIPRLVEEIFMTVILSYVVSFLLSIYDRLISDRTQ